MSTVEEAMAMQDPDRGPNDYPAWDDERRILINIIRKQTEKSGGNNYSEGGGDNRLLKWVLGVLSILTASAVIGGVSIYGKVASLEATVATGLSAHEQRLDRLERAAER